MEKIVQEELMALIPVYMDMKGNCTSLYTVRGGIYNVEKSIRTILNQLSEYFLVDLKASRKYYGELLFMTNLVPIPFNENNVFIPLKVRKPLCKNDGSVGYINIDYIESVSASNDKTIVHLKNKTTINSLNSIETVNKHIKNGHIVKKLYTERYNSNFCREYDFYTEYNKPATKGDIAFIMHEIMEIKENIK